ncbi:putative glycosyltransferase [Heterostelium album PN500]|uniref:Putative glycosyltransferase n=1 Tax=Heterostelium pallidum (strain ATCC 26659 / Pp 5 / PN500) TaxID=670386 RepID=D3B7W0_HETP5|nr:putative glycosyltransferase [Heterostelium album PN500]EFA82853.1 putative glycosyltransferase [Heterostelium album PN500]|eukprot:XP_020434970.1 putative glycosyltransferase [Heterostelium album PN500]
MIMDSGATCSTSKYKNIVVIVFTFIITIFTILSSIYFINGGIGLNGNGVESNNNNQNVEETAKDLMGRNLNQLHPSLRLQLDEEDQTFQQLENFKLTGKDEQLQWSTATFQRKRRVLIVTTEIEGPVLGGGIGTAYTALSQRLADDGHIVTVLVINYIKKMTATHWQELYATKKITIEFLSPETTDILGCTGPCIRSYHAYKWIAEREHLYDVLHFHDNGGIAYFSALARSQGISLQKSIVVVGGHGPHLWERTANSANLDDGKHFEVDYLEKRSVELSDWLISPSNYMLNWMRRSGWVLPKNSYVHQNLLPGTIMSQPSVDKLIAHSFDEIIFFGRLEARKGLDIFLRALDTLHKELDEANILVTFLGANTKLPEVNMLADQYIVSKCRLLNMNCRVLIGRTHTEAIAYLTDLSDRKLVVIPSPIDNSPNTVLECMTHNLAFISTKVGGIPELIDPKDRARTLFSPAPNSLIRKIRESIRDGVYPARMAKDEWFRHKIWSNWHSVVPIPTQQPLVTKPTNLVTVVLVHNGNNDIQVETNLMALDQKQNQYRLEVVIATVRPLLQIQEYQYIKVSQVEISEYLVSPINFQPWNSEPIVSSFHGEFILFVDQEDWLSSRTLNEMLNVAKHTGAHMVSSSIGHPAMGEDISSVYMGCIGMPGMMYNCYGSNNVLMNKLLLHTITKNYTNEEIEDEFDYGGPWELYSEATNRGFSLETIPKALFFTSRTEIDLSSTYNQELRVLKYFQALLPPSLGISPLATRHFLISKGYYLNEINTQTQKVKQLEGQVAKYQIIEKREEQFFDLNETSSQESSCVVSNYMESRKHIGMVFIRGHEKSGTSWLKKVVGLHPRIQLHQQEFHFHIVEDAIEKFTDHPWAASNEPYVSYTRKWYKSFVRNLLLAGVSPPSASIINYVGEKTPSPLAPIISGSKYILIIRDGRDVVVSLFWHYVRLGGFENWCGGFSKQLVEPGYVRSYNQDTSYFKKNPEHLLEKEVCFRHVVRSWAKRIREDLQTIDDLKKNPAAEVYVLRYEELHRDTDAIRTEMYQFLGLDPAEAQELSVEGKTIAGGFQEEGEKKNKFFRKGEIGDWQNYFSYANKVWFKEEAGHELIQLGYELDHLWVKNTKLSPIK